MLFLSTVPCLLPRAIRIMRRPNPHPRVAPFCASRLVRELLPSRSSIYLSPFLSSARQLPCLCADPSIAKSMPFTGRANVASSLLRQHDTLGATAIDQPTFHVYIVAVCYIVSKIICIIAIICLTWKISEIICYNVSLFGREAANYANYNKLLWQLSQRFCAKNNML